MFKLILYKIFKQKQKEWQIVFIICAVIYFLGAVVFWLFCESELQPWAKYNKEKNEKKLELTGKQTTYKF